MKLIKCILIFAFKPCCDNKGFQKAHHPASQPALNFVLLIQFRITQGDGAYAS